MHGGLIFWSLRENYVPIHLSRQAVSPKPTATVLPTATDPTPSPEVPGKPRCSIDCKSVGLQTDEAGIDVDILMHVEDMVRTQRSLVLPSSAPTATNILAQPSGPRKDSVSHLETLKENERLRQALSLQTKVSNYEQLSSQGILVI